MLPRITATALDAASDQWVRALRGPDRDQAARLLERLLRIARDEIGRRRTGREVTAPELDDLAHEAGDDAVLAVMRRVHEFRGESRFTTWAFNASGPLAPFECRHLPSIGCRVVAGVKKRAPSRRSPWFP
jgi:hypothetical protein